MADLVQNAIQNAADQETNPRVATGTVDGHAIQLTVDIDRRSTSVPSTLPPVGVPTKNWIVWAYADGVGLDAKDFPNRNAAYSFFNALVAQYKLIEVPS